MFSFVGGACRNGEELKSALKEINSAIGEHKYATVLESFYRKGSVDRFFESSPSNPDLVAFLWLMSKDSNFTKESPLQTDIVDPGHPNLPIGIPELLFWTKKLELQQETFKHHP